MERLNVIPYPNKVEFTGGTLKTENLLNAEMPINLVPGSMGEEAYILTVTPEGVSAECSTKKGMFYAQQTLIQLVAGEEIPCCVIEDEPAFPYRGFMIDTVRHIVSVEDTKKMIDAAASLKFNAFHWHLTDDQGWRAQIDSRPLLCEKGSVRSGSFFGREESATEYGGYFTKDEMKEIVAYAEERFIDVIPEIDMPGHSSALLHAYPEITCKGKDVEVKTKQGIYSDIICAGKDESFSIIFDIIDELCDIFPGGYFHIGGDEVPKTEWSQCPDCKKRKAELGIKSDNELQRWFMQQVADHLKEKGKTAVVWNDAVKAGEVEGASVQFWMGRKKPTVKIANGGGRIIVSDFYHYYTDYNYAITPLKKTYNYNPVLKGLNEEGVKNTAGVETPVWTEYIKDFDRLCFLTFPRYAAVAENGWTLQENKDEEDFERRFEIFTKSLRQKGITPADKEEWNPPLMKRFTGARLY